ncbi:M15 family metallopeptidase [Sphingomonas arantia]|uniref:M15 family metallopeptidase n=1 Tax=Sphingomonas arantia TaxID=1460676 RepID=A0ABW4TWH6_9SPHN
MSIILGARSLARLIGVHPDLVRVVKRAALMARSTEDFTVLEGVRSDQDAYANWGKGRTVAQLAAKGVPASYAKPKLAKVTWLSNPLSTKHRKQKDGFGHAVDLAPFPVDWSLTPSNMARFDRMAKLLFAAAEIESVEIRWGADWDGDGKPREKGEGDSPHFELVI